MLQPEEVGVKRTKFMTYKITLDGQSLSFVLSRSDAERLEKKLQNAGVSAQAYFGAALRQTLNEPLSFEEFLRYKADQETGQ